MLSGIEDLLALIELHVDDHLFNQRGALKQIHFRRQRLVVLDDQITLPDLDHCGVLFADGDHRIRLIGVSRSERREQAEGRADGADGDDQPFASEDRARPLDPINLRSLILRSIGVAIHVIGSLITGSLKLRVDRPLMTFERSIFICHGLAPSPLPLHFYFLCGYRRLAHFVGADIHTAALRPGAPVIIISDAGQGETHVYRRAVRPQVEVKRRRVGEFRIGLLQVIRENQAGGADVLFGAQQNAVRNYVVTDPDIRKSNRLLHAVASQPDGGRIHPVKDVIGDSRIRNLHAARGRRPHYDGPELALMLIAEGDGVVKNVHVSPRFRVDLYGPSLFYVVDDVVTNGHVIPAVVVDAVIVVFPVLIARTASLGARSQTADVADEISLHQNVVRLDEYSVLPV